MVLFVLRKLILKTRMRSHPVCMCVCGWVCVCVWGGQISYFWSTLRPLSYFMCANSEGSGETARMRRLAWAFAGRLCYKYHNLMSWLICSNGFENWMENASDVYLIESEQWPQYDYLKYIRICLWIDMNAYLCKWPVAFRQLHYGG